jgi:hypothetical protein
MKRQAFLIVSHSTLCSHLAGATQEAAGESQTCVQGRTRIMITVNLCHSGHSPELDVQLGMLNVDQDVAHLIHRLAKDKLPISLIEHKVGVTVGHT